MGEVLFAPVDEFGKMSGAAAECAICRLFPKRADRVDEKPPDVLRHLVVKTSYDVTDCADGDRFLIQADHRLGLPAFPITIETDCTPERITKRR